MNRVGSRFSASADPSSTDEEIPIPQSSEITNDDRSLRGAIDERVVLADPDPAWRAAFSTERDRLMAIFPGRFLEVAHIGSTAVDGLRTKPVIDVLAGVRTMQEAFDLDAVLPSQGYFTPTGLNAQLDDRQFFFRHKDGHRTHHLHLVVHASEAWRRRLLFRDLLRSDASLRLRYAALKERLVALHGGDRDAYTEAKGAFIEAAIDDADHVRTTLSHAR